MDRIRAKLTRVLWIGILFGGGCIADSVGSPDRALRQETLTYPVAARGNHVDIYHGRTVADPYRWMEDEDSEATTKWLQAQIGLFDRYVETPALERLTARIREIGQYDAVGIPVRRGDKYFFIENKAGAQHGALHVRTGLNGKPRKLVDFAEVIHEPGHRFGGFVPSPNGRHVVWASQGPTRWGWLDVAGPDGKPRPAERIDGIAGNSAIWTRDSEGFFYMAYGDSAALVDGATPQVRLAYHRLGQPAASDQVLYRRDDHPSMLFTPKLGDDGRYLVVALNEGTSKENQVIYKDLRQAGGGFVTLIGEADASYTFEGNVGRKFFFSTTLDAPRSRLIAIDLDRPGRKHWTEVIPQKDTTLTSVSRIGSRLVVGGSRDARPFYEVYDLDGKLERKLELPDIGWIGGFADDPATSTTFYSMMSLYDTGSVFKVDLETGKSELYSRPKMNHSPDDFEIRQVFYKGKDGTRIPMFVAHRKGLKLDGSNPTFMYGYGHGGWVAFPWFQSHLVAWMELGGVYALPNIRGGGEYGAEWQEAGTRRNKQTTIDDFVAAAEWLIAQRYTSPARLVANGGSASGVLAAAATVQRPDLFGAALVEWPFLDMLRYHEFTVIKGWTSGYGASDDPEDFKVLAGYSPLHNLEAGKCYPPTLTVVGEDDTSTVPMHGYKYTAALQALGCDEPYLLKFVPEGGHYSYGTTPEASTRGRAEVMVFLLRALGIEPPPTNRVVTAD